MTTNQLPIRQCRYYGSDDLGLGWQHGEGIVTASWATGCAVWSAAAAVRCCSNGWQSPTGSHLFGRPRKSCDTNQR
jgi:hypothetical protein